MAAKWDKLSGEQLLTRLRSILINAAEGRRSLGDDRDYELLRKEIPKRGLPQPAVVNTHPTVDSFSAAIKDVDRLERTGGVTLDFQSAFESLARSPSDHSDPINSSSWTGDTDRVARLKVVRTLLPLAQTAVESMIETLAEPNPNGGPLLDERVEAIEQLRQLHGKLGELLSSVDAGRFEDELGQSLAADAARYAKRAARALRDDPMPYLASALLLGILSACGLPGIGGYLGGVALNLRKHTPARD